MKIISYESIKYFSFWGVAVEKAAALTWDQMDEVEAILEDMYPDGIEATALNDLFAFYEDEIAEWLGYDSFEHLVADNNGEE